MKVVFSKSDCGNVFCYFDDGRHRFGFNLNIKESFGRLWRRPIEDLCGFDDIIEVDGEEVLLALQKVLLKIHEEKSDE